jgi:hypothetical protein
MTVINHTKSSELAQHGWILFIIKEKVLLDGKYYSHLFQSHFYYIISIKYINMSQSNNHVVINRLKDKAVLQFECWLKDAYIPVKEDLREPH